MFGFLGTTGTLFAKSHLNLYSGGNPLIINRSSPVHICAHTNVRKRMGLGKKNISGIIKLAQNYVFVCALGGYLFYRDCAPFEMFFMS